jgi:hypothetical protein
MQHSHVLAALAESLEDAPTQATLPFPPTAIATWQSLVLQENTNIELPILVQGLGGVLFTASCSGAL